jgi:hypothetical protein
VPKQPRYFTAQMTAAQIYESVTNGGASDFGELVAILNRNTPWCLIGGLAVNCYVEPVYTVDIDLVVVAAKLAKIEAGLKEAGVTVERFAHSLNAQRPGSKLSAQFTVDERYQDFLKDATEREALGAQIPVAALENIIRDKVWARLDTQRPLSKRKKDELDLIRIAEAHPELRHLIPSEITKQLE